MFEPTVHQPRRGYRIPGSDTVFAFFSFQSRDLRCARNFITAIYLKYVRRCHCSHEKKSDETSRQKITGYDSIKSGPRSHNLLVFSWKQTCVNTVQPSTPSTFPTHLPLIYLNIMTELSWLYKLSRTKTRVISGRQLCSLAESYRRFGKTSFRVLLYCSYSVLTSAQKTVHCVLISVSEHDQNMRGTNGYIWRV